MVFRMGDFVISVFQGIFITAIVWFYRRKQEVNEQGAVVTARLWGVNDEDRSDKLWNNPYQVDHASVDKRYTTRSMLIYCLVLVLFTESGKEHTGHGD